MYRKFSTIIGYYDFGDFGGMKELEDSLANIQC